MFPHLFSLSPSLSLSFLLLHLHFPALHSTILLPCHFASSPIPSLPSHPSHSIPRYPQPPLSRHHIHSLQLTMGCCGSKHTDRDEAERIRLLNESHAVCTYGAWKQTKKRGIEEFGEERSHWGFDNYHD
ncbi:hypothetical protein BC939DRAFT_2439 [Gamsiella multidivaricata]|uniref:uncharacterized protein n=1 Tax=Gamsiella multidivaricata TaxID=101098 RepID=UPI00221FE75F|nr:uncharacterized protein BC939DRAFT_2439 [Gamsiella multidivaricata]KAI7832623.1 hypothetical protein BC939DRAFT_2439 [Gamsiella multidivaricata]